jgi:hypothetical protein
MISTGLPAAICLFGRIARGLGMRRWPWAESLCC